MATFDYNRTNLGAASLSSPITAAATTATVGASDAATFPTAPFYATIMPVGETPNQLNSEIVQVTANNSGALGLVRAQRGTTAKAFDAGALVMNGVYIQDLEQAQAVGKSFFSATLTGSVYYINDSRVPTTPADGDSIRVVFGSNWTSGTPQLSLNNGTAKNIYAGNNLTSGNASTTTNAMVKSGVIYELTYYNGNWYVLNLVANNSITSDNMDWTTLEINETPIIIGYYSVGNVKYTRYKKRILVDGLKDISVGSYRSVPNVIPSGVTYATVNCWLKRTIVGPGYIYEAVPNYFNGNSVSVLIDANRGLRIYNYGGIATSDVSVSAIVDIEHDIAQ